MSAAGAPVLGTVTVRPPATSANLGPGFDAFGLALELRDEVTVTAAAQPGLAVAVTGEGADEVPCDENHLIVRSLHRAFDALGVRPSGLRVSCVNRIPHGRGLGSSSAAICAGLSAARELAARSAGRAAADLLDDDALLDLAADIEGHPDNVAPALRGGFTIAWHDDAIGNNLTDILECVQTDEADQSAAARRVGVLRLDPDAQVGAVVFIPPQALSTESARKLLPGLVPHRDASLNAGRAGLLSAALTAPGLSAAHRSALLLAGTADRLHQGYRAPAMPDSAELISTLRSAALAAAVSGAGPTVLTLVSSDEQAEAALKHAPADWTALHLPITPHGVTTDH